MQRRADPPPTHEQLLAQLARLSPISELHVFMTHCGMDVGVQPSKHEDQLAQVLAFLKWAESHNCPLELIAQRLAAHQAGTSPAVPATPAPRTTRFLLPPIPPHFVPRPDDLAPLIELVLGADESAVGVTSATQVGLHGKGGVGKSALMIALGHEPQVRERFRDGVCWLGVGQAPKLEALQAKLLTQLLGRVVSITDVEEGRTELQTAFGDRSLLILLDDVWDAGAVAAFQVQAANCRLVFTTRDRSIPRDLGVREQRVGDLPQHLALQLLAEWAGTTVSELPPVTRNVAQRCGYSPLALKTYGAYVRDGDSWEHIYQLLCAVNLAELRKTFPDYAYLDLYGCVEVGVTALASKNAAHATRYRELAVFCEDARVPEAAVQALWKHTGQLTDAEASHLVTRLVSLSLLESHGQSPHRTLQLHDVQRDYLRGTTPNMPGLHEQLIESYRLACRLPGDWSTGPQDGYFDVWISEHLRLAGQEAELHDLLGNYAWLRRRVEARDIESLLDDYKGIAPGDDLHTVAAALRLSSHVLAVDPQQLPSQLSGWLAADDRTTIVNLLSTARTLTTTPWLRPRFPCLDRPGASLIRTFRGHQRLVRTVSVYAHGNAWRAVSGSHDGTLKVWDLETGCLLRKLEGHRDWVVAIAVYAQGDSWRAVSAAYDRTLRVWDLETGQLLHNLKGHDDGVNAVSVYAHRGTWRAVSASHDGTLKAWDLETGQLLHNLAGHKSWIHAVSVYAQGTARRAVSASYDRTLKVWDLETGRLLHNLEGHQRSIHSVSVYPQADAWRALSASNDGTLKVWDLEAGRLLHNLVGHQNWIHAVSVYAQADAWRAVSASFDKTLKVWDLETARLLYNLEGHHDWGRAVSVFAQGDGWRAVSSSEDQTLKVWDLETGDLMMNYHVDSTVMCVVPVSEKGWIIAGDQGGKLQFLALESSPSPTTLR